MKLLFIVLLCIPSIFLNAQENHTKFKRLPTPVETRQIMEASRQPRKLVLPLTTLNRPSALSAFIKENSSASARVNSVPNGPLSAPGCLDSSFTKLMGIVDNGIYVLTILHTKDDGVLIAGLAFDVTVPNPTWQTYGVLIKADNMGNVLWKKLYKDEQNHVRYEIAITFVSELNNGDIITVSSLDTAQGNTSADFQHHHTLFTRLSGTGNLIWYKTFQSKISLENQYMPIDIKTMAEATNGDMIFCGRTLFASLGGTETIIRMSSAGNIIWDVYPGKNGEFNGPTEGINVFLEKGNITVVGMAHGTSAQFILVSTIHVLTLDFATGTLLTRRTFTPDYNDQLLQYHNLVYNSNYCIRLTNGHFLLWGQTFVDFSQLTSPVDHFAVVEFDTDFNLVDAYTITSNITSNYWLDYLHFENDGRGLFQIYEDKYPAGNTFQGSFYNKQLRKERFKAYNNIGLGSNSSFGPNRNYCFFNDSSYLNSSSYFEDYLLKNSYVLFKKMHNSDTSSECLGRDSITVKFLPYLIGEDPPVAAQPLLSAQTIGTDVRVSYTDEYTYNYKNPCEQKSLCDTLKIHGDTVYCNTQQPKIFSVYKNPLCGSFAEWIIDTSVISAMTVLNDTSVAITFKNKKWTGKIFASLSTGKCTSTIYDSLEIRIAPSPAAISLGTDISLCPGNTVTLHAGSDFEKYKWQDNSTDSIFTLSAVGKYFVEAKDYCGNVYSDTLLANPASYNFSLGADITKCNSDTVKLTAPAGFLNYQWSPAYNIAGSTQNSVLVFPVMDTSYSVIADKGNGCIVKDTIRITVLHSPAINLGSDTSLCEGSSILLNAGAGFDEYKWSNGANTQTLTAFTAGNYSVEAINQNGCLSRDTIGILQIIPLPVFSLGVGSDTVLCEGQKIVYNFNVPGASFTWSDGSSSKSNLISTGGLVWLKMTRQGCSYADSINVLLKPAPVVTLGKDTTICEGTSKLLDATYPGATYNWQDGSTGSTYLADGPGTYIINVTLNTCTSADTIVINYKLKPSVSLGADQFICNGTQLTLQPVGSGAGDYRWQDGSTTPMYTVKVPGVYSVTSTNDCGTSADSVNIMTGPCSLWLPSAFTPGGDGKNDLFRIKYVFPVNRFSLIVFNRWGQKVFETGDMSKGWDGKYNGLDQPQDVYIWMVSVVYPDNRKEVLKGSVTLIR